MTITLLAELRSALLAKRASLKSPPRDEIAVTREADPLDQVAADAMREQAERTTSRVNRALREVDDALARIKDGSYGVCLDCEEEIAERRLRAVPEARFCLACQGAREQ